MTRYRGLAFAPKQPPKRWCGGCSACQGWERDLDMQARIRRNGQDAEILGSRPECLRKGEYDVWVADHGVAVQ